MNHVIRNNIISMPDWSSTPEPKGLGYFYYKKMKEHGHKVAQIDGFTKEKDTYDALLHRSIQTAITLQSKSIRSGDFISLCTLNHLNTCVPYIASLFIGAKMAAVDPSMSVKEIVNLLKQILPKIIFVSTEAINLIEEVVKDLGTNMEIVVFGETVQHTPFSQFLTFYNMHDFKPVEIKNLEEIAFVTFSSGTTGFPKGICYSHRSILSNTSNSFIFDGVTLTTFPSPYWSAYHLLVHCSIIWGGSRLIYSRFDANAPWQMFNHNVTIAGITSIQAMALVNCVKPEQINLSNVKVLTFGGTCCTADNVLKIKAAVPHTIIGCVYGQSEVFFPILDSIITTKELQLADQYISPAGTVKEGFSYKVVDVETEEVLGPNQRGELLIKSRAQCSGYYNMDSREMWDSDGWLKTGDLAYYTEDLLFFIVGRIKETFKYICHHIIPSEIENVLLTHPSVQQAFVVGIPHEVDCNHATAVVVLKDSAKNVTPEELVKYVEERVEDKKRLRGGVKFTKNIPFTVTGKAQRFRLTQMVINNEI